MRGTILLPTLIAALSTVAVGQTNARRIGFVTDVSTAAAAAPCRGADLSVRHVTADTAMADRIRLTMRSRTIQPRRAR